MLLLLLVVRLLNVPKWENSLENDWEMAGMFTNYLKQQKHLLSEKREEQDKQ